MTHGVYRVIGRRRYRGHDPGTEFTARIPRGAEQRAIQRGDIALVDRIEPDLLPGSYTLPADWQSEEATSGGN